MSRVNFLPFFNLGRNLHTFLDTMEPREENKNLGLEKWAQICAKIAHKMTQLFWGVAKPRILTFLGEEEKTDPSFLIGSSQTNIRNVIFDQRSPQHLKVGGL